VVTECFIKWQPATGVQKAAIMSEVAQCPYHLLLTPLINKELNYIHCLVTQQFRVLLQKCLPLLEGSQTVGEGNELALEVGARIEVIKGLHSLTAALSEEPAKILVAKLGPSVSSPFCVHYVLFQEAIYFL
jgi:hypothetical protein